MRFSATRLQKYLDALYLPIAQKAINHGLYVVIRPPGVCPKDLKVGDAYQNYLKTVWNIVSSNSWVKNNSGIVSLELANEPVHIYNRYGQSSATAMRDYFQPVVDVIRKNGFKGIIWIPGTGYQSQYENYASYPVSDSNFGYAVHVYPGWYGASDTNYDSNAFIYNFQKQVPVVKNKPILVSEIDWSPERPGAGKYNEFGQWVASNLGSWGTATTSKWGNAWKKVMDHFGNISMTLTSTDDYLDIDNFLKTGQIKAGLEANPEACGQTCFYWYYEYSKKDYAHKSAGTSSSKPNTQPSTGSSTSGNTQGENIIKSWGNGSGFVPSGWTVADNGTQVYAGNKSSGPRIMNFSGDFKNAFYVRTVSADKAGYIEYGNTNGYTLPLVYGEYELSCNVAAWKGAPYMKVEVFDPRFMFNRTVKDGQQANGGMIEINNKAFDANTNAIVLDLKKDLVRTVPGEEPAADDFAHLVTIKAPWGGEVLISTIMLYNTLPEELGGATGIKNVNVANDAVVATFNAAGAKVAANAKGLVIKKFQNGKVVKVMNK